MRNFHALGLAAALLASVALATPAVSTDAKQALDVRESRRGGREMSLVRPGKRHRRPVRRQQQFGQRRAMCAVSERETVLGHSQSGAGGDGRQKASAGCERPWSAGEYGQTGGR